MVPSKELLALSVLDFRRKCPLFSLPGFPYLTVEVGELASSSLSRPESLRSSDKLNFFAGI